MNQVNKKALSLFSIVSFSLILNISSISAQISFDSISNKIKDNFEKIIKLAKEHKTSSIAIAITTTGLITYGIIYNKNKKKKENTNQDLDNILDLIKNENMANNNQDENTINTNTKQDEEIIFIEQNPIEEQKEEIKEQSL